MERREKTETMLAHVAAQKQSGKGRRAYAAEHGISLCVLNYWCVKAAKAEAPSGFAPVEVAATEQLELHYPNGVRMVLPANTALAQVAACIRLY
ncbi:MAG: hypothetical protein IPL64_08495 [Flavobacteriales bacterium]|jgi:hypothetical protein|nr:hypothetical protein [Flavobacteriales bacterium]